MKGITTFGVIVVIVAVMGTALFGSVASVERTTEPTTTYTYVNDVSGLFDYTTTPEFVDYNPPENWTGFYAAGEDTTSGITYIESERQTRYPVKTPVETTSATYSMAGGKAYTQNYIVYYIQPGTTFQEWEYSTTSATSNDASNRFFNDIVDSLELPDDTAYITINAGSPTDLKPVLINFSNLDQSQITAHGLFYLNTASYTYNHNTGIVTANSENGTVIWRAAADNVLVTWGEDLNSRASGTSIGVLQNKLSYTITPDEPIIYMDISEGIGLETAGESVTWRNGYANSAITALVHFPSSGGLWSMVSGDLQTYDGVTISAGGAPIHAGMYATKTSDGITVEAALYRVTGGASALLGDVSLELPGTWQAVLITLDAESWTLTAAPVAGGLGGFTFTDYQMFTGQTISAWSTTEYAQQPATISSATVYAANTSIRFGIVDTSLYMNTNHIVMQNPALDVRDYFTDTYPRLDMDSFAYYGSNLTINGTTWSVDDGLITIVTESDESRTITLESVSIRWGSVQDPASCTVIFNGEHTTNVGEIINYSFSAGGVWYFTTSYYAGEPGTISSYAWNPGEWAYQNDNAAIAAYMGILVMSTLAATKLIGRPGALDLVIIAAAGIAGFVLLM